MASSLKFYQTWQAKEGLYFSHIEARLVGFSGTRTIQRRKQIEANKGFTMFRFFFFTANLLSLLNLRAPLMGYRLGLKEEAIIAK